MSLATLRNKVEQLIEKAESSSSGIDWKLFTDFSYLFYNNYRFDMVDDSIDTSNGVTFRGMFEGCSNLATAPQLDTSNGVIFVSMFYKCSNLIEAPQLNTSKGTSFTGMFANCTKLTTVPPIDTSNGTTLNIIFLGCSNLVEAPQLDVSKCTTADSMFAYCSKLENVSFVCSSTLSNPTNFMPNTFNGCTNLTNITISSNWKRSLYLHYSTKYSTETLHALIENFADMTGKTAPMFQIGTDNITKIDAEHINMLTAKNWQYK